MRGRELMSSFNASACTPALVEALERRNSRWLQSAFLACVAYGIVLTLFCMCVHLLLRNVYARFKTYHHLSFLQRVKEGFPLKMGMMLVFVMSMTTLSTLATAGWMQVTEKALVRRGCWDGVTTARTPVFLDKKGNYAFVFANWGADGILVWRCWVISACSCRVPVWIFMALPVSLYLAVIGLGLTFMMPMQRPGPEMRTFEMAYSCLTLALNIVVTGMITTRLLIYRYQFNSVLGKEDGSQYTSLVAMLIESAALVVIFNAFFVATIRMNNLVHYLAFAGNVQVQIIAPLLIIFRVLQGKAWTAPGNRTLNSEVNPRFASMAGSDVFEHAPRLDLPPRELSPIKFASKDAPLRLDLEGSEDDTHSKRADLSVEMKRLSRNVPLDDSQSRRESRALP